MSDFDQISVGPSKSLHPEESKKLWDEKILKDTVELITASFFDVSYKINKISPLSLQQNTE